MQEYDKFGENLRAIRLSKKVTVQALSRETGLSMGYIRNIERDISSPTLSTVGKICDVLNVSLKEILKI